LYGFEGEPKWRTFQLLVLTGSGLLQPEVVFLNGTPYILLHIFIVYLESFPKHYNKTFFH